MSETATPELRWIREPLQTRSQKTLERLLDATERLLEERTFPQISVAEIAAAAQSSVGSFYARFANKDALLQSLHERNAQESRLTADRALGVEMWRGVPLAKILETACTFMVGFERQNQGLKRAVLVGIATDERMRARACDLGAYVTERITALFRERASEMSHPDPERGAQMFYRVVFSVLDQTQLFGWAPPAARDLTDGELAAELTRTCLGYLGVKEQTS